MRSTVPQAPDPTEVGERVLEGLAKGREKRHREQQKNANRLRAAVKQLAIEDAARGHNEWGRAGRIKRKLKGLGPSEQHLNKILKSLSSSFD